MIRNFFQFIFIAGLFNAGIVILLGKWGVLTWYEAHRKNWMPNCNFCLTFWLAVVECFIVFQGCKNFNFEIAIYFFISALSAAVLSRHVS